MLKLALLVVITLLLALPAQAKRNDNCPTVRAGITFYRNATWKWQDKLHASRFRSTYSDKRTKSCAYLRWVAHLWQRRTTDRRLAYRKRLRYLASLNNDPKRAICFTFGPRYCAQALAVARCESGWAYSVNAHNGQYLGLFQMGSSERYLYGHGSTALEQARAAYRYFAASGYDWSPWSCKPW